MQSINRTQEDNKFTVRDIFLEQGDALKTLVEKSIIDEIKKQMDKTSISQPAYSML